MQTLRRITLPLLLMAVLIASPGPALAQDTAQPTISVGSLSFTEPVILGEMISLMLEDAGYSVERRPDLGVTTEAHEALVSGEIDLYVEYTGGGLVAILGLLVPTPGETGAGTPEASIAGQTHDIVAAAYLEQFGLVWLDEFGFNNTYALAVTAETAAALGLVTVSDLAGHASELTLGTDLEFPDRQDGLPGLEKAYGFEFGDVLPGEPAQMYEAIAAGEVDVITAYSTDGRLPGLDLVLLEDDLSFFPPYYAAPVVDLALLEAHPEIREILNQLAGRIDDETMAGLNELVDVEGMTPVDVARAFLEEQDLIGSR
jgi:glycine betaine/choline ABC-type transport system substrate-binding protein